MAEKLSFDILLGRNTLKSGLQESAREARNLEDTLVTAAGVFAGNLATKGFELLGDAVAGTTQFLKDSVAASVQKENALNNLSSALRRSGEFSNTAVQEFDDLSDALERASVFSGDAILEQLALAKSLGLTNRESKDLVSTAVNLAAVLDVDLETAVRQLNTTYSGQVGTLGRLIPQLKDLTEEQLKSGEAVRFVSQQFGGAAAAQVDTFAGAITQAENAFGKIQEEIGNFITQSPSVIGAIQAIGNGFEAFSKSIETVRKGLGIGLTPLEEQRTKLKELGEEYNRLADIIAERREFEQLFRSQGFDDKAAVFTREINALEAQRNEILKQRQAIRGGISADQEAAAEAQRAARVVETDQKILQSRIDLQAQLNQLQADQAIRDQETKIANLGLEDEARLAEIESLIAFEIDKTNALLEQELNRAAALEDVRSRSLAEEIAVNKAKLQQDQILARGEERIRQERLAGERIFASQVTGIVGTTANLITAFTKEGSKEAFFARQAASLASAIVATNLAIAQANAVPPPGNIAAIAAAKAQGAIAISGIAAAAIKGFQDGGFIGGANGATIGGDTTTVNAREGELVLNADDQRTLLSAIKGGGFGSNRPIVIEISGREIARVLRDEINSGFTI